MTSSEITVIRQNKCVIGEGPIWNELDKKLYFVNSMGPNEICTYDYTSGKIEATVYSEGTAAIAFSKDGRMLVSRPSGAYFLDSGKAVPMYDTEKYSLKHCNDSKVGPDGRLPKAIRSI